MIIRFVLRKFIRLTVSGFLAGKLAIVKRSSYFLILIPLAPHTFRIS